MSRICPYKADLEKHLVDMKSWFQARGHPIDLVLKKVSKVKFSGDWDKETKKSEEVTLDITFHSLLKNFDNI